MYIAKKLLVILYPQIIKRIEYQQLISTIIAYYQHDISVQCQNRTNVGIICIDGRSYPKSSAFIRLISPLIQLAKIKKLNLIILDEKINYNRIAKCDILIIQRTVLASKVDAINLVKFSKQNRIPLILDTDDAFHAINSTHPEYESQIKRLEAMKIVESNVEEAWLSTEVLAIKFEKHVKAYKVFPNTIDARIWRYEAPSIKLPLSNQPLRILYMGTATHDADFKIVLSALESIHKSNPDSFSLTVIGVGNDIPDHDWITRLYQPRGGSIYPKFVEWFNEQGPFDVGLAPLVDSEFNRSKSDIKCLDYLAAGIDPIVSDVPAYKTAGLSPYITRVSNTSDAWKDALLDQIENKSKNRKTRNERIVKARAYIKNHRSTEVLADQMYERITALVEQHKK